MTALDEPRAAATSAGRLRPAGPRIPGPRAARPLIRLSCLGAEPDAVEPAARDWPVADEAAADEAVVDDAEVDSAALHDAAPDDTAPDDTAPDDTAPDDTAPDDTAPDDIAPDETAPDETAPDETASRAMHQPAGARPEPEEDRPFWRSAGLAAGVAAVLVGVVVIALAIGIPGRHRAGTAESAGRLSSTGTGSVQVSGLNPAAQAAAWSLGALGRNTRLLTDGATGLVLMAHGFPASAVAGLDELPPPEDVRFIVSTGLVRAASTGPDTPLARLIATSWPVANFGSGPGLVQVRQIVPADDSAADEAAGRVLAGQGLLRNAGVSVTDDLTDVLATGRLDLRAATLLAVLAGHGGLQLTGLPQDPVEAAAGAPVRTVQLSLPASVNAAGLASTITTLPAKYRPVRVERRAGGQYLIGWSPDLVTAAPIS